MLSYQFKDRAHQCTGSEPVILQFAPIGNQVLNGSPGNAAVHGRAGHTHGNAAHETPVKGFGQEIFRAEAEGLAAVSRADAVRGFFQCQIGQRLHAGDLHFMIDDRGAYIQCPAKQEGETQHVVDLIRIV